MLYYDPQNPMRSYNAYQPTACQSYVPQPQGLVKVTGIDGAKAYQMPPNSVVPLFDANEDILYVKSTDGAGFPTIREFSFSPVESQTQAADVEYVPRQEFEKLVEQVKELIDGKQPVSSKSDKSSK